MVGPPVLVSACLLGEAVRHDGRASASASPILRRWLEEGRVLSFCPECAGGLPVPRPAAEIIGPGGGRAVLAGSARVRTREGEDVTQAFVSGARRALQRAVEHGVKVAVLKARSPSCGSAGIHAGEFDGQLVDGQGVTAALLQAHGVRVFDEYSWEAAEACLAAR